MLSKRSLSLIVLLAAILAVWSAFATAGPSLGTELETQAERVTRRNSLRERAAAAYERRSERKDKLASQLASRHTDRLQKAPSVTSTRKTARAARQRKQQAKSREAEALALRIAEASSPALLKTGRARARALVKRYLANVERPGPSGPHLLELLAKDVQEFVLQGTRMYSLLLIVSGRDYYGECAACRHTHEIHVATAERYYASQEQLFRQIAAVKDAAASPLALPVNVLEPDATALPVVPVAIDATTYMDFLRANQIQGVPQVVVLLPTMAPQTVPVREFMSSLHATHQWRYPSSGANNDTLATFVSNLFAVRAQHSGGADPAGVNTALTDVQSAQNPIAIFFQSIPLWTVVAASWIVVVLAAFVLRHVALLLSLLRQLKPLVLLVAVAGWCFNISGGLFMRTAGADFVPGHLKKAPLATIWSDPPRWVAQGFREQFGVEGAILTVLFVAFTFAAAALVMLALRSEAPAAIAPTVAAVVGAEGKPDPAAVAAPVAAAAAPPAPVTALRRVWSFVCYVVFGVIVPAALIALLTIIFLHVVRVFLHKVGGYVREAMWCYELVARYLNKALVYANIPTRVPRYLVRNLA
jgi:hypothetical protein